MDKATKKRVKALHEYEKEFGLIKQIDELLSWDQYTILPNKAALQRAEQLTYLSEIEYKKSHNKNYSIFIDKLHSTKRIFSKLPRREKAIVQFRAKEIKRDKNIPLWLANKSTKESANGYLAWVKAKKENDFSIFKPHLKNLINISKQYAKYRRADSYSDAILNYEDEGSVKDLDVVFSELKDGLLDIISNIKSTKRYNESRNSLAGYSYNITHQKALAAVLCEYVGMDSTRSVCADTVHPFQTSISLDDKRMAIAYKEDNLMFCVGSVIHEFGHLLYELGIDKKYANTCLSEVSSMSLHESQSRLWENHIGLSKEFWKSFFPVVKQHFPKLHKVSEIDFYRSINTVSSSNLIRIESDELHYALHIIIRYEIERDLLSGKLSVNNLQKVWNQKYKDYFGIVPNNDSEGVLQDVHWSEGMFGYFPSYTIGDIYSTMFWKEMVSDQPEIINEICNGQFKNVHSWLNKNIHKHGATVSAKTLVKKVCKKNIDVQCHLTYLRDKYYELYDV